MEAKSIYIATIHMKSKIDWDKSSGNEWSFVGEGSDFKELEVQEFIDSYFTEDELYLVIDRHNSFAIPKSKSGAEVKAKLSNQDITLCNNAFSKMVEFSYIGVAKHGAIKS
ncbi:hypothetical protein [Microbulbifer thermotolerans]|uniref:hypothetical protein n=2 Tax=Microbulbifer thermotolerans TaxID=252514 RepID=UPI00224AFE74|nr:hypothetical protein [Microbulbifer thermotolerans]MCX2779160.1 hypothetical protein [Microbulbifer thermotolerans]MCX2803584.1 hypothetical protein [Microbulbifer thermotolerans]MCX2840792.1 hypothetical protein [Microbulbifer thermotolerans]